MGPEWGQRVRKPGTGTKRQVGTVRKAWVLLIVVVELVVVKGVNKGRVGAVFRWKLGSRSFL